MTQLTASALAAQEKSHAQGRVDSMHSHAAKVVHEERTHQYFSQLGILKGIDIINAEYWDGGNTGACTRTGTGAGGCSRANRDDALPDTARRDNSDNSNGGDLLQSLKIFVPHLVEDSGTTPLERFLTLGESTDPSYIRHPALTQAQYYGNMDSVETRISQAHVSADRIISEGQARKGSTGDEHMYK
ncbi:hypothetical protein TSTA_004130 [Talaromyces stipitatus ATCC 10500]|uniref:Uncharacterized protein n=1 Tax=Talaromyces stipitatus (strain ATCC 10500 / CBS 375.48 / QM 6759 / NRRL 1006) TaxID=441959 RepID=B8MTB2_TALSN|nr:uncharacterized protein TSTA_004130 [Talaromyces stipitatus ATCC 10500]EED12362.1 hypothetical protein TSTA_004130 [Talaromyces stipitatus ATCC 10500]